MLDDVCDDYDVAASIRVESTSIAFQRINRAISAVDMKQTLAHV